MKRIILIFILIFILLFVLSCGSEGVEIPSINQARYMLYINWVLNTWVEYFSDHLYLNGRLLTHEKAVDYIGNKLDIMFLEIEFNGYWEPDKSGKFYYHDETEYLSANVMYVYDRLEHRLIYGDYKLPP